MKGSLFIAQTLTPGESWNPKKEVFAGGQVVETVDDRDLEEERARLMEAVRTRTWALLAPTDWYVTREADKPQKQTPIDVVSWRDEVRAASDYLQGEVEAATTLAELDAVDLSLLWTIEAP